MEQKASNRDPIKVMVVDDHEVVREGVVRILERQGGITVVALARTGEEAMDKIILFRPEVVIVDIELPGINGIELIKRIKHEHADVECVTLTVYDDEEFAKQAIKAGAIGYVVKDAAQEELVHAVVAAAKGESLVSTSVARKLLREIKEPPKARRYRAEDFEGLSERELDVLKLMAKGFNNRQIANQLFISELTVKVHIRNIFRKLGVGDRTKAVLYALEKGLA
ncbi:MAG: response regulator [Candidatus Geothermincolia bacterium]